MAEVASRKEVVSVGTLRGEGCTWAPGERGAEQGGKDAAGKLQPPELIATQPRPGPDSGLPEGALACEMILRHCGGKRLRFPYSGYVSLSLPETKREKTEGYIPSSVTARGL